MRVTLMIGVCDLSAALVCMAAAQTPIRWDGSEMRAEAESLKITVLYDNFRHDAKLESGWGFGAALQYDDHAVLFDTGADGPALLANLGALAIDPRTIEAVVLSHAHDDHTGGLEGLLAIGVRPTVYLLPSFPEPLKRRIRYFTTVVETGEDRCKGGTLSLHGRSRDRDVLSGVQEGLHPGRRRTCHLL